MVYTEPDTNNLPGCTPNPEVEPRPWHWAWALVLGLVTVITLAFRYAMPVRDGDLWFHMLYGKYFLENKTLVADHTIFSWTPSSNEIIYCTWLPDICFYLLHKTAGLPGIFSFRYLCLFSLVLASFLYARKLKISTHPLFWFMLLLAVLMSYTAAFDKPEILSFVYMTMVGWNWWHIRSSGEEAWKSCYLFPFVMLLWVNSHGGFVFGAVFLALVGLGELLNTWLSPQNILAPRIRKHLIIALLLAAITPLLTPYGYHYPLQFFNQQLASENVNYRNIGAYSAPFLFEDMFYLSVCADLSIVLLVILFCRNLRAVEWSSLLANLVFAFLYTRFLRTTFYWCPIFLFSGLHLLAITPVVFPARKYGRVANRLFPIFVTAASLCLAGDSLYKIFIAPERFLWMGFGISESNPVDEARYIKKYFPKGRIGNTYDQGAYLLWELWPENKVFFDARHFPYRQWSNEFFEFIYGKKVGDFVEKNPCDLWCVSLEHTETYLWFVSSSDWKLAYYGKNAAVFVRQGTPLPEDSPIASPSLSTQKSTTSAVTALTFALNIQDWQTADRILARMREEFTFFSQKELARKAEIFAKGFRAYYQHEYEKAVAMFDSIYPDVMVSNVTYAFSLIHLSAEAWERGDGALARKLNQKAWPLYPGYYMNIYNAGAMNWYDWQKTNLGGSDATGQAPDKTIDPELWRYQLQQFLDRSPQTIKTDSYRQFAQDMLRNTFAGYPALMVPVAP